MKKKITLSQIIFYLVGLNILSVGTVMSQYGHLGVGALTSIPQIMAFILPVTLGQAMWIFFIAIIIMESILLRKIKIQIFLQLLVAVVFGSLVDFYGFHLGLENLQLSTLLLKALMTIASIILTAIGIFIMVKADFILMPTDALVRLISKLTKKQFGKIKFCFDFSSISIAIILSFFFLGHIAAIGIGTVAAVIFVGQLISAFERIVNQFNDKTEIQ